MTQSQTRIAVLISWGHGDVHRRDDHGGLVEQAMARVGRWAVGRPPQGDRSIARRAGIAPDALATRLVAIPDSASLRETLGDDEIPFILDACLERDAGLEPAVLQFVDRCGKLTRADLASALLPKWPLTLRPSGGVLPIAQLVPVAMVSTPTPVRTCAAYREAHDALTAYVKHGDEGKAMAFAEKWGLTIRKRTAVLNGLLMIDWKGVPLFDNEEVIATVNRQVRSERDNAIPLYRRRLKHKHIASLQQETADANGSAEDQLLSRQALRHPCVDVLLADFTPEEAETVARWAAGGPKVGWHHAALYVKAKDPERFALRVRRKLKRAARKHLDASLISPCRHCGCGLQPKKGI